MARGGSLNCFFINMPDGAVLLPLRVRPSQFRGGFVAVRVD